jgi:hypothetical protein
MQAVGVFKMAVAQRAGIAQYPHDLVFGRHYVHDNSAGRFPAARVS